MPALFSHFNVSRACSSVASRAHRTASRDHRTTSRARLAWVAVVAAGALALTGCGSEEESDPDSVPAQDPQVADDVPDAPENSEHLNELAKKLEANDDVVEVRTTEDLYGPMYQMAASLESLDELDVCQQANLDQYQAWLDAAPETIRLSMDPESFLSEEAATETIDIYLDGEGSDGEDFDAGEFAETLRATDEACTYEDNDIDTADVAGENGDIEVTQVIINDLLTSRLAEATTDTATVRFLSSFPPGLDAEDLPTGEFDEVAPEIADRLDMLLSELD